MLHVGGVAHNKRFDKLLYGVLSHRYEAVESKNVIDDSFLDAMDIDLIVSYPKWENFWGSLSHIEFSLFFC